MLLKLVAIDVETGNFVFQEVSEGLPAGTIVGQLVRWNGTDWVETDHSTLTDDNNSVALRLTNGGIPSGKYAEMKITDTSALLQLMMDGSAPYIVPQSYLSVSTSVASMLVNFATNRFIANYSYNTYQRIEMNAGGDYYRIDAFATSSDSNKCINLGNAGGDFFNVYGDGKIFSKSLTANTYLGANANKEIVSIPSPNVLKDVTADITSTLATEWTNWVCALNIEANVTYELSLHLVFGNVAGRNGVLRLDSGEIPFTYRPIITGNVNSISDNVIIMRNTNDDKPDDLSNEAEYTFQTTGYKSSIIEMRGIFRSAVPIPVLNLKFKTLDNLSPLVLKAYSYLKLSR